MLDLVVDAFVQNLSVIGYRTGDGEENAQAWQDWQRNKMDARQAEIYTSAIQYGTGYVAASPSPEGPCYKVRSPRQMMAVYEDPQVDDWPQYAIETWIDQTDGKPRRKGTFFDDTFEYPLDLGDLATPPREASRSSSKISRVEAKANCAGLPRRRANSQMIQESARASAGGSTAF